MKAIRWIRVFVIAVVLGLSSMAWAQVPERINFQGVLRTNAGSPIDGAQAMTFRLYDTDGDPGCTGGMLLLIDAHPSVSVSGGLFNTTIGGGTALPGALSAAVRGSPAVWVEVEVGGEVLCPRVQVISAAYSLNADYLDGKDAADFLDTSASPQTKAGDLAVNDLTLDGNGLFFGQGARALSTASGLSVFAGDVAADNLLLFAGSSIGHGSVSLLGDGALILRAGSGFISFGQDGVGATAALDPAGNLQIDGALTATSGNFTSDVQVGGGLVFADGSIQTSAVSSLPADTCFDNVGRFVVCGDGTVKDNLTGLYWLEDAGCSIADWAAANVTAAQLADGQCGLTDGSSPGDWRLPTYVEWQVIVDQAIANGCSAPYYPDTGGLGCWSEGDPFSGVASTLYWSSTTRDISPSQAWTANLFLGNFGNNIKTSSFAVWPVRAGP